MYIYETETHFYGFPPLSEVMYIWKYVTSLNKIQVTFYRLTYRKVFLILQLIFRNLGSVCEIWQYIYIYIYIYIYRGDRLKKPVERTKPSSGDDYGANHGFVVKASLAVIRSMPSVSYNTTRFCGLYITPFQDKPLNQLCQLCINWQDDTSLQWTQKRMEFPYIYRHLETLIQATHTHTHTHIYIYIYIYYNLHYSFRYTNFHIQNGGTSDLSSKFIDMGLKANLKV